MLTGENRGTPGRVQVFPIVFYWVLLGLLLNLLSSIVGNDDDNIYP